MEIEQAKNWQSIQSHSGPVHSGLFCSCLPAVFSHVHALSLVSWFVEYSEHPGRKMDLHISLNARQKLKHVPKEIRKENLKSFHFWLQL